MTLGDLRTRAAESFFTSTTVVVTVLIASMVVAGLLAFQAISMARSRQAVSEAMLREYADLAAWEFSREARKDVDSALARTIAAEAHPDRRTSDPNCDCAPPINVDYWFETAGAGTVVARSAPIPADTLAAIAAAIAGTRNGSNETTLQIHRLSEHDDRLVVARWEPHLAPGGGQLGFVMQPALLKPVLARAFSRAALLPPRLIDGRKAHELVQLRVVSERGAPIFAPEQPPAGPQIVTADLFPGIPTGLRIESSMSPAFIAALGPEHGGGLSNALVVSLVLVNTLMVLVGLWQFGRERELARLRGDFVAGVSHELRTPLAQIRMFTDTLLLDRVRNPGERRRALEIIGQETRRLTQLVENVLYFHLHRRAPDPPALAPVDLTTLVRDVSAGFAPLAASRRVRIELVVTAFDVIAHGNEDALRQVLLNLLNNAVKFGPADQLVTVSLDVADGKARIGVTDQGPGVAPADQQRIFRAFERGRETGGVGGAGIGLAIVRQIVAAHGGDVHVEPAPSQGARFVVTLPIADAASHDHEMSLAG